MTRATSPPLPVDLGALREEQLIVSGIHKAFACAHHLTYRVKLQKKRSLSPDAIGDALLHLQCSILKHVRKPERYAIPSAGTVEAELIYEALGLQLTDVPYALNVILTSTENPEYCA